MLFLLSVCTHVHPVFAENDSRTSAPESTQAIGISASVRTPRLRPNTALSSQLLHSKNAFPWIGLKHPWVQMDWIGKYTAKISASAQNLHTVVLCELKTYTNLCGFFKRMKKSHSQYSGWHSCLPILAHLKFKSLLQRADF